MRLLCKRLRTRVLGIRQGRRNEMFAQTRSIAMFKVVPGTGRRADLQHGQCLNATPLEDAYGDFPAFDTFLDENTLVVAERFREAASSSPRLLGN
jgi:hypothetical protein